MGSRYRGEGPHAVLQSPSRSDGALPARLRFGRFELLPVERQLLNDGHPVVLGARAFDLLLALIERRDRLVGKGELLDLVWPGLVVEEANVPVQVSGLRRLIGAHAIATVPGRGYRFAMPMRGAAARAPGQMFARLMIRLSSEIRQLTREIPLREGRLLELENETQSNEGAIRRVAEEIRQAREQLKTAETDLVQLEVVLRETAAS